MNIAITGATGLLGTALLKKLATTDHHPIVLTRHPDPVGAFYKYFEIRKYDTNDPAVVQNAMIDVDVIINLAGESIAGKRWTKIQKQKIYDSRVKGTQALVQAISQLDNKPKLFIQGSAVGFYGNRGDEELTEESTNGADFLALVCVDNEKEADKLTDFGIRVLQLRTGVVLSKEGGAWPQLTLPFKLFVGGKLGNGQQWFPWIHITDWVNSVVECIENPHISGPVNAVAPNSIQNIELTRLIGKALKKPAFFTAPKFALKMVLGEMADSVLTSQHVKPEKLLNAKFEFDYPNFVDALIELY